MVLTRFALPAAAAVAGIVLLAPVASAADAARAACPPCVELQSAVDAYRSGEIQYFVDPVPAWRAEAERNGCVIRGL
ncbi:hypothetical protein [Streptomyces sp. NBC_01465]|uniref:hypothetical protein n=1 Tax=Streptomyces sp. NBC_01465 TaxID=2903878 RepID=UPI002E2FF5EF|nr:hypothetical protein [Streptomyces sp. NBC_01465]